MIRTAWLLAACLVVIGAARAIEPPQPAPSTAAEEPATGIPEQSPIEADETAPEPEGDEETLPPLPPEQRRTGPTPQRFDPSEEVRADFPVSFPIDI